MPNTTISTATTAQILISDDDRLRVTETGSITHVQPVYGSGDSAFISVAGTIDASNGGFTAITSFASAAESGTRVRVAATGEVIGGSGQGIYAAQTQNLVRNAGTIRAEEEAIQIAGAGSALVNEGTITVASPNPNYGTVTLTAQASVQNLSTGQITGGDSGIYLPSSGNADNSTIVNSGTVTGGNYGILVETGVEGVRLINEGTLQSDLYSVFMISNGGYLRNDGTIPNLVVFGGTGAEMRNFGNITSIVQLTGTDGVTYSNRGAGTAAGVNGSSGADHISGGGVTGWVDAGGGNDTITGGAGTDRVLGGAGSDKIRGNAGNDLLYGDGDNDRLIGNGGNDTMLGGAGLDLLIGGMGDDSLTGGTEADVFLIRSSRNGDDVITDFEQGTDRIDLSALGLVDFSALSGTPGALSEANGALVIDLDLLGGSGSVTVTGLTLATVDATDFLYDVI